MKCQILFSEKNSFNLTPAEWLSKNRYYKSKVEENMQFAIPEDLEQFVQQSDYLSWSFMVQSTLLRSYLGSQLTYSHFFWAGLVL